MGCERGGGDRGGKGIDIRESHHVKKSKNSYATDAIGGQESVEREEMQPERGQKK